MGKLKLSGTILGLFLLLGLIVWQGGFLQTGKISPESKLPSSPKDWGPIAEEVVAVQKQIPVIYRAVGTVQARTSIQVASQVTARVKKVLVRPGEKVSSGQVLINLDGRELQARLDQAKQSLAAAKAQQSRANQAISGARAVVNRDKLKFERMKKMYASKLIASQDLEVARAAYLQAQSGLSQARESLNAAVSLVEQGHERVKEASIALDYTDIKAPGAGEVVKRLIEPGDMALAGKPLLELNLGDAMQLSALVREKMISKVALGQKYKVEIDALGPELSQALIEEIEPSADPLSRTFVVKAALSRSKNIYPGMFGRLLIPEGFKDSILIPQKAVQRIGQLEMVLVKSGRQWMKTFVRTGQVIGDQIEVLSGVKPGEILAIRGNNSDR